MPIKAEPDSLLRALQAAGDIAYDWDIASDRLTLYGETAAIFGARRVRDGAAFHALVNAEDLPRRLRALDEHAAAGAQFDCDYRLRRSDGGFVWVHDRGRTETDAAGAPRRMTGMLRIVTERKAAEENERERAIYDDLTGHYNQSRLRESLEHALSYAQRYKAQGGYLVVGFDAPSGRRGEEIGDNLFIAAGQRLEQCLRTADLIGRLDGDRFGIVLSHCTEAGLSAAAGKIVRAMAGIPAAAANDAKPIGVSIGGVLFPSAVKTVTGVMAGGDSAQRDSASAGGGFILHRPPPDPALPAAEQRNIADGLLAALRENRIAVAYQPVIRSADGHTAYFETLLRIEDGGTAPASVFMPVAERLGYAQRIDRRMLELAAADLAAQPELVLAINISGLTVTDRTWFRRLSSLVKPRPDIAERLIVEITETAALYDFEDSLRFIAAVRAFGCRVALDDFGVGHTSFRQLKTFPVDIVKIDGSYVRGIADDRANQEFVDNLLDYTESFGLDSVAECVESQGDHDYLVARGVTYLQGWMHGHPERGRPAAAS